MSSRSSDSNIDWWNPERPLPESFVRSLYLSGPAKPDWRHDCRSILRRLGYVGTVFDPIIPDRDRYNVDLLTLDRQLEARSMADVVIVNLAAENTVSEGTRTELMADWPRALLVRRNDQENDPTVVRVRRLQVPEFDSLEAAFERAFRITEPGALRRGGHRFIPQSVYRTPSMQAWLMSLEKRGNTLQGAEVLRMFPSGFNPFLVVVAANIRIGGEDRNKTNEVVVFRPDMTSVVLMNPNFESLLDSKLILTLEFRSAGHTDVLEPPGGSDGIYPKHSPSQIGINEVREETNIILEPKDLIELGKRQSAATLASHSITGYLAIIDNDQLKRAEDNARSGKVFGVADDTERTRIVVATYREALAGVVRLSDGSPVLMDWTSVGLIKTAYDEMIRRIVEEEIPTPHKLGTRLPPSIAFSARIDPTAYTAATGPFRDDAFSR